MPDGGGARPADHHGIHVIRATREQARRMRPPAMAGIQLGRAEHQIGMLTFRLARRKGVAHEGEVRELAGRRVGNRGRDAGGHLLPQAPRAERARGDRSRQRRAHGDEPPARKRLPRILLTLHAPLPPHLRTRSNAAWPSPMPAARETCPARARTRRKAVPPAPRRETRRRTTPTRPPARSRQPPRQGQPSGYPQRTRRG